MKLDTPTLIGRYEILAEIGRGSMGIVYKARDPKIDRTVAIKTILLFDLDGANEKEYRQRFFEEARAAGRLSHPGIVTVFDVEPHPENANPYIVMEYVEGKPLDKLLEDNGGRLPMGPALRLGQEIAEALHLAHSQGVIHRDIKPENILVTTEGRAKIADFGIARLDHGHMTVPGRMLGSPAYMAPEQLEGENTDARSDLFSLGVVLYTMLTGHRPFQGNSTATVCFKVANRDPLPVSSWNLDFPLELDELVGRAMAKDPALRFQTGQEMAEELQNFRAANEAPPQPLAGIMRIIGQEPEATPEPAPEAIVAEIPELVIAPKETDPASLAAIVSSALHSASTIPAIGPSAKKISGAPALFFTPAILWWAGAAAGALLVIIAFIGFAIAPKKHSNAASAPSIAPSITAPTLSAADYPAQDSSVQSSSAQTSAPAASPEERKLKQPVNRSPQPLPHRVRPETPSSPRHALLAAAPPIHPDIRTGGQLDVPSAADSITVQMLHLADLNVTIEHSFQEGQASISVDNRPVYTEELSGQKKRLALVFTHTQGRQSGTITLLPGKHDILVRVQSVKDRYDASQSLTQGFAPGSSNQLLVKCDKRKNKLELSIK
jgi:eukaryotic-like serine/threonine-protein kinase